VLSSGSSSGVMEAFSYKSMKSFGATDSACFGFRVQSKNVASELAPPKSPRGGAGQAASTADDVFVCLVKQRVFELQAKEETHLVAFFQYSEESAHLQNALVMRYARRWEELKEKKEEPPHFPSSYSTAELE